MDLPIETMSIAEKLDAMEQLWASLSGTPLLDCMPDWHAKVLQQRRERVEQGLATFSPLEDVAIRLQNPGQ